MSSQIENNCVQINADELQTILNTGLFDMELDDSAYICDQFESISLNEPLPLRLRDLINNHDVLFELVASTAERHQQISESPRTVFSTSNVIRHADQSSILRFIEKNKISNSLADLTDRNRALSNSNLIWRAVGMGAPTIGFCALFANAVQNFAIGLQQQPMVINLDPIFGIGGFMCAFGCLGITSTFVTPLVERALGYQHKKYRNEE